MDNSIHSYKNLLDRKSSLPLYFQLREILEDWIKENKNIEEGMLPTGEKISQMFGVSITTVRQALNSLVDLGLIESRPGKGTLVIKKGTVNNVLPGFVSFTEEMSVQGLMVVSHVLDKKMMIPPKRVQNALELPENTTVLRIDRLRFVENEPVVLSTSYLPNQISIEHDFSGSLYELLKKHYGFTVASGRATLESDMADKQFAQLCNVRVGAPVLRITWLASTYSNFHFEYSEATFRSGKYKYTIQIPFKR